MIYGRTRRQVVVVVAVTIDVRAEEEELHFLKISLETNLCQM